MTYKTLKPYKLRFNIAEKCASLFEKSPYLDRVDRRGAGLTRHPLVAVRDEAGSSLGCGSMGSTGLDLDRGRGGGDGAGEEERRGDEQRR